jgi:hypothetical protein
VGSPPPLTFEDEDLFAVPTKRPATRRDDRATSFAAADKVAKAQGTIRATVLQFAQEVGPVGFIDDDLIKNFGGDGPESSWRKRRQELFDEGVLVDLGRTRANRHGNQETIWMHHQYVPGGAPAPARAKPVKVDSADLKARGRATADEMLKWSRSMSNEGRMMFASALKDAAEVMRLLSL